MKKLALFISIFALALPVVSAPGASAETFKFQSGPLTNLDPAGATINGGFTKFSTKGGMYIQQCVAPIAGARPATCSDDLQLWVSANGEPGSVSSTGPIAFKVAAQISGRGTNVDCTKSTCGLFFRLDRTAGADTSEDLFLPISFRAGAAAPLLPADIVTVTLNSKLLTRNVPSNLAYRQSAQIVATSLSGLPVTLTSLTPECSYANGNLIALKGAGQCALAHRTTGNDKFAASSANYPFILQPGIQQIERPVKRLLVGKPRELPIETSFGSSITYKSLSNNCRIELNVIQALEKGGSCIVTATAPAKEGMWREMSVQLRVLISALTPRR
jgi:hypothetical protein